MKELNKYLSVVDKINNVFGKWVSLLVIPCTLVLFYEVIMRYLFNAPTIWVHETSNYFFGALFVLGGAYTLLHSGHVNVEILYNRMPIRLRAIFDILTSAVFYLMIGVIFWFGIKVAVISVESLETSHTVWGPPVYPMKLLVPIGAGLMLLQGTVKLIRDIGSLITGVPIPSPVAEKEAIIE